MRWLVPFVTSLFLATAGSAQEKVGTAVVEGKVVDLYSDFSWSYAEGSNATDCEQISREIQVCLRKGGWENTNFRSADVAAQYIYDDRHYGQLIIEKVGLNDGMDQEFMRAAIISNFASAANVPETKVMVHSVETKTIDAKPAETVIYSGTLDGLDVIFANSIVFQPELTVQIVTFAVGSTMSAKHTGLHEDFVSFITFR